MDQSRVAELLKEIGVLLELKGENQFKTRAYSSASRTVENLNESLEELVRTDRLSEIRGVGTALQEKIRELVETGSLKYYEELKSSIDPGLIEMLEIPGLGPKKVRSLHQKLEINTVAALEDVCRNGKVESLTGFGKKTQDRILKGIEFRKEHSRYHLIDNALVIADRIRELLRSHPDVIQCSPAGSLRRHKEVIRDLDFLVSSRRASEVIQFFIAQPDVKEITAQGETKASVVFDNGFQGDLRVVSDSEFAFALAYFTGSKEHNVVMRQRAKDRGERLNEYGLYPSSTDGTDAHLVSKVCHTEEELFLELGLDYIEPELRENMGEFEASESGTLPKLIEWTQLRGSLHNHSKWSDGDQSFEQIAELAEELGLAYWAITDHSRSSFQANGLNEDRLLRQIEEIKQFNIELEKQGREFRLLAGTEVDILNEGKLDFDADILSRLEVVVASVHSGFTQSESEMTRRLIRAVENPNVNILGHMTGRLLLKREAYAVNQRKVIDACSETGTFIEINANPRRLDLDWRLWNYARNKGVRCVINCDAHRADHFAFLKVGAGIARKGWLTPEEVVNTRPVEEVRALLRSKRE
ncbi:MAG TPA: DNA polymerase/3'-5' exonuclease PolX [Verrucomicrobiales bacterium]|nr:DNA polymerase/3'-5' exonuclease PolX [Verrucomicrobiales bacterium]